MGKLTKFKSGDVLLKKALPKPEAFIVGEFAKAVAEDTGAMVKVSGLQTFAKLMKDEKWEKPVVHLGVAGGDLVITGQSADGKKDSVTVYKGYAKLKADRAKVAVINADKGDPTIDSSTDRMAKAKGVKAQNMKDADIKEVKGDIIILAHGGSSSSSPGKIYAKSFANKKPADIARYLYKDKELPKNYAGTIYLDGCFTGAGPSKGRSQTDLNNFAGTVYSLLKKQGYGKLQVKGNLGAAVTLDSGGEGVVDAQMQAEYKKRMKKHHAAIEKARKVSAKANAPFKKAAIERATLQKQKKQIEAGDHEKKDKLLAAVNKKLEKAQKAFDKAKQVAQVADQKLQLLYQARDKAAQELAKKHNIKQESIEDLVGTFGPERI